MRTYFVRHTTELDIDAETRRCLWREKRIAIHYPQDREGQLRRVDNSSLNLEDYPPKARRPLKALLELARHGGYVCAQHHGHEEAQVGHVPSCAEIQLLEGRWGSRVERPAIPKTIQLDKVGTVRPAAGSPFTFSGVFRRARSPQPFSSPATSLTLRSGPTTTDVGETDEQAA